MRRSARLHDKRKAAEEIEAAPISTAAAPETPDSQNVSTNAENVEFPTPNVPTAISDEQGTPSTGAGTTNKRSTKRSRDASEADTPGTSKQATKRRKTGKNGESSHAQALTAPTPRPSIELPREMWLRIASFLKIFPYLRLSHANKNFRQLLTQGRQAETVLTGCRRRDRPELPDPDDDTLCEWAYLELLYGIGCQSCGKPRIRKVTWQWHV
ncbi:uncharacterized protein EV422DRAFT_350578, partial [Fimicolochytrium jonesii]|uniref:uncharacterized protein n=1 Tax=Fimicolochytrium jonesii TaxID=1396493 RepID=UPI0022FE4C36